MAEQIRVLVTHDIASVRAEIAEELIAAGCETRSAHNGLAALAVLADGWRPDCIVMKPAVPGLDGEALRAELRMRGSLSAIPLIAIVEGPGGRASLEKMAPDALVDCSEGFQSVIPTVFGLASSILRVA
jgi:CheY-like chemotaxis protein